MLRCWGSVLTMVLMLAVLLLAPIAARATAPDLLMPDPASLCLSAIAAAQQRHGFPPGLLSAIGRVESGRRDRLTGALAPWPWTVDVEGEGHFYETEAQAIAAVRQFQAQGRRSIDVGCMQVNLAHHPDAFADLAAAFDPITNARYAADFLNRLRTGTGDWLAAVGLYHSASPELAAGYRLRVEAALAGGDAPLLGSITPPPMLAMAASMAPFARGGGVMRSPILRPPPPRTDMIQNGRVIGGLRTGRSLSAYRAAPVRRG